MHELLIQEHSWILDLFYDAMEEAAMAKAIAEGKDSENLAARFCILILYLNFVAHYGEASKDSTSCTSEKLVVNEAGN